MKNNVTWSELRYAWPFLLGVIALIFFLANISFNVDALKLAQIEMRVTQKDQAKAQILQGIDISEIKGILMRNKLSYASTGEQVAFAGSSATPTPTPVAPGSSNVVVNQTTPAQDVKQATTPPSPTPTPTVPLVPDLLGIRSIVPNLP